MTYEDIEKIREIHNDLLFSADGVVGHYAKEVDGEFFLTVLCDKPTYHVADQIDGKLGCPMRYEYIGSIGILDEESV